MKIAFINPPFLAHFSRGQRSPAVTKGGTIYYPYHLAYAAAWAEKNDFEVGLFDFVASKDNFSSAIVKTRKFDPEIAVIETSTPSIFNDLKFAEKLKSSLPKVIILLVGTHVSALPEWTLKQTKSIDGVVAGEYDQAVVELAKKLRGKKIQKINTTKILKAREFIKNLDDFPFVSEIYRKFLNPRDYFFSAADYPMLMITTGRGCPFGCSFCVYPQVMHGSRYRFRSANNVVAEFEYIQKNFPEVKEVVIEDDTFTADIGRVREICLKLIEKKNKLSWSTNARVHLDLQTMRLMKEAGCRLLIVGYESGSQALLDSMGKKINLNQSLEFARKAKEANLLVHGCFMVGNLGETAETMEETLRFAQKLDPDSAQFYPLFVYPGTKAFAWAEEKGYLKTRDFRCWLDKKGNHQCVVDLPGLSAEEMMEFCNRAYFKFHFRPRYIIKKLGQVITNHKEGIRSLKSGVRFLNNYLNR